MYLEFFFDGSPEEIQDQEEADREQTMLTRILQIVWKPVYSHNSLRYTDSWSSGSRQKQPKVTICQYTSLAMATTQ